MVGSLDNISAIVITKSEKLHYELDDVELTV